MCVCVCMIISFYGLGYFSVQCLGFTGTPFFMLRWMFQHNYLDTCCLSVLYACVLYFCICTCSSQLSMFHMERRSRNTLVIIIMYIVC